MNNIFSFDIDGTICDSQMHWLNYLSTRTNQKLTTKATAKRVLGENLYDYYKHLWRLGPDKFNMPVYPEIRDLITFIYDYGGKVYFNTSRPLMKYPRMLDQTANWLVDNGVRFEAIQCKTIKSLDAQGVLCHVDDEVGEIMRLISQTTIKRFFLISEETTLNSEEVIRNAKNRLILANRESICPLIKEYFYL